MKQIPFAQNFEKTKELKRQMKKNHRSNKDLSNCRHCDYFPIARNAHHCPNCGGLSPRPGQMILPLIVFMGVVAAILLFGVLTLVAGT